MFESEDYATLVIDQDVDKQAAIDWIIDHDYTWTEWGYDQTSPLYHPIFTDFKVYNGGSTGIPQTYVIDADGNVRYAKLGMISDSSTIINIINELL